MNKVHKNTCCKFCGDLISHAFVDHECGELYFVRWMDDGADVCIAPVLGIFAPNFELAARAYVNSNSELADLIFNHEYVGSFTVSTAKEVFQVTVKHASVEAPYKSDSLKSSDEPHPYFENEYRKACSNSASNLARHFGKIGTPLDIAARQELMTIMLAKADFLIP